MAKGEKINFTDLNGAFSEKGPKSYTEEELLGIIRSPDALAKKGKAEQLLIFGAIVKQMQVSEVFRREVLEELEKSRQKPTG